MLGTNLSNSTVEFHHRLGSSFGLALAFLTLSASTFADYLPGDLRARVDQLKEVISAQPTNDSNANARARLTWEWINAHALNGGYVPVNATQITATVLNGSHGPRMSNALDATIHELAFIDETPNGLGTLVAETGPFEAGSTASITQTYTVGDQAIQTGGGFVLARHFMTNFGTWQTQDPNAANFIAVETSNPKVSFVATTTPVSGMHGGFRGQRETLTFRVASGTLTAGDQVSLTYGDTKGGSPGMTMPTFSSDRMPLPVYVQLSRDGQLFSLPIQPIRIEGGALTGVHGFVPSVVAPGETFEVSIRAQDIYFNRAKGSIPNWQLSFDEGKIVEMPSTGAITVVSTSLVEPGIYFPKIKSSDGAITGVTNPILVTAEDRPKIMWGDTHGHSGFAEGIGTPERFMTWARDDARLDYVTHSEHDIWLDDYEWEVLRENVINFTEEGKFIAYLGYEWTVRNQSGGHHNVLFRSPLDRARIPTQFFPTLPKLYAGLRNTAKTKDVVVIPHAHQSGDFRISDPELEPLIEIMSQHGNFEWFGRMYINQGHQVGFTAASDNHLSQPGYSSPMGSSLSQQGGLGAILAQERTTDGIFDAMKNLQSYATTGDRIILDFAVNGTPMGQRAEFSDKSTVSGRVIGTAPIRTITVVKNDGVLIEKNYFDSPDNKLSKKDTFVLTFSSESSPDYVKDNPRGWRNWDGTLQVSDATLVSITPLDANMPSQTVALSETENTATLFTRTRGDSSSFLVELSGITKNTSFSFDLTETAETGGAPPIYRPHQRVPATSFVLALKDLVDGTIEHTQTVDAYEDRVRITRDLEETLQVVDFEFADQNTNQGDFYFVRVVQANDAIAWSSPVWIGGHPPR
ncbi:MAG: DUF3604 domain-containing protein [Pseudomonadales bacterium]|nr:DUF3604 domain-containing protein [Pseudomonadales bacterium]